MKTETLKVVDLIGSPLAGTYEDGQRLYQAIKCALSKKDTHLILDFSGVELLWVPFIDGALGPLYSGEVPLEGEAPVEFSGLSEGNQALIDYCHRMMALRQNDPDRFDYLMNEVLEA